MTANLRLNALKHVKILINALQEATGRQNDPPDVKKDARAPKRSSKAPKRLPADARLHHRNSDLEDLSFSIEGRRPNL